MKRRIRRILEKRQCEIRRRLAEAWSADLSQPTLPSRGPAYQLSERSRAIAHGGIGLVQELVGRLGLARAIDESVRLLKVHRPYHESDHVLNIAFNLLCDGQTLDDIELRRNDAAYLDALGVDAIPDPTTAGDFCRRFEAKDVEALMDAINAVRRKVWAKQGAGFLDQTARIDADGTIVGTSSEWRIGRTSWPSQQKAGLAKASLSCLSSWRRSCTFRLGTIQAERAADTDSEAISHAESGLAQVRSCGSLSGHGNARS